MIPILIQNSGLNVTPYVMITEITTRIIVICFISSMFWHCAPVVYILFFMSIRTFYICVSSNYYTKEQILFLFFADVIIMICLLGCFFGPLTWHCHVQCALHYYYLFKYVYKIYLALKNY